MTLEHTLSVGIPILTLMLGWFLNSITPLFDVRRENRKALSKAIADLLEIRHTLLAQAEALEEIKKVVPLAAKEERVVRTFVGQIIPSQDDLQKRFDETVTLIASFDPLLGFKLRHKDFIMKGGPLLAHLESQAGSPIAEFTDLETHFARLTMPHLNEVILDLARRHSRSTFSEVKRYLNKPTERPEGFDSLLKLLQAQVQKLQSAGDTNQHAPDKVTPLPTA